MPKNPEDFFLQRQHILSEMFSGSTLKDTLTQEEADSSGGVTPEQGILAPTNLRVVEEILTTNQDGTTAVEVVLEWDDPAPNLVYEIQVGS